MAAALTGAALLRSLHRPGSPLVLPNAWDVVSARAVVAAGFPVVATSSSAVAEELGRSDGELSGAEMFTAVGAIAASVRAPVTADLERGYGLAPDELAAAMAVAGVVGCNLEDTDTTTGAHVTIDEQCAMLAGVRQAADAAGLDLVINARIDTFLHGHGSTTERLADGIRRARAYLEAGADCVFPLLLRDLAAIHVFVERVDGPVNVLAGDPGRDLDELAAAGVARISFGGSLRALGVTELAANLATISTGTVPG